MGQGKSELFVNFFSDVTDDRFQGIGVRIYSGLDGPKTAFTQQFDG